jgi:hypothetical protein
MLVCCIPTLLRWILRYRIVDVGTALVVDRRLLPSGV